MGEGYVLEWLDTLISVTLNPAKNQTAMLYPEKIEMFQNFIDDEKNKVMATIKCLVFNVDNETKARSAIKLYHSSLIILLDQALKNQNQNSKHPQLTQISNKLIDCIDEILSLIEERFSNYLDADERLPTTNYVAVKKELITRIFTISNQLKKHPAFGPTANIISRALLNFLDYSSKRQSFTFQEIAYIKELCFEIEHLEFSAKNEILSELDEVLIYMNFNERNYLENLTQRLTDEINCYEKNEDRMEWLLFYFKLFKQIPRKASVIFNPKQIDLQKTLSNWFRHEIFYLEKKMHFSVVRVQNRTDLRTQKVPSEKHNPKVMCTLSTDQAGLIIRAADELRILVAKSMSEVFKTIVPHLSTPYKKDLSYDGMRSKSYVAEERDKQIAIYTLQRIIKKIEEY
jgi:hypothetical protein